MMHLSGWPLSGGSVKDQATSREAALAMGASD
jgi:hypothetical protein